MCDSQRAQVIDNRPLSMLGNEISCSSARFCGSQKPRRTEREREKLQRDYTAGQTDGLTEERGTEGE